MKRPNTILLACLALLVSPAAGAKASVDPPVPPGGCRYVEAGRPGPAGNLLLIDRNTGGVGLRREGEVIVVQSPVVEGGALTCEGPRPTVHNIDRIVYRPPGGGEEGDTIYAGPERDVVDGGGGNDTIHGEAGRDRLQGGEGSDRLFGGAGDDELGGGSDEGGPYFDFLSGGGGRDSLRAIDGNRDRLICGGGPDNAWVDPFDEWSRSTCEKPHGPGLN